MCGRSRCALDPERVTQVAGTAHWVDRERYRPSHNLAPGAWTPVVRSAGAAAAGAADAGAADSTREVQTMRWGLVPSFTKPDAKPDPWRMFNARSETVGEKPAFRRLVPSRRCLVLMNGFYEWKKEAAGPGGGSGKQPYYVHLAGDEAMVAAGLWDVWHGPDGDMHTYTILTCDASPRLEWLHDRMPVILRDEAAQALWLDSEADVSKLGAVLRPYNGDDLRWHAVTKAMSNVSYQEPDCWAEVKKPLAQAFFRPRSAAKRESSQEAAPGEGAAAVPLTKCAVPPVNSDERPGNEDAAGPKAEASPAKQAKRRAEAQPSPTLSAAKKQRPAGQQDISQFFTKKQGS